MKKIFTIALASAMFFFANTAFGQSQRMAFVEEATQASCPPCATANPGIQTLVNNNSETTLFLGYQVWWPGFDQMYLDNTAGVDERVGNYYPFTFAPQIILNGTFPGGGDGGAATLTQGTIDEITAQPSEFDMDISAEVADGFLHVTGTVTATMVAEGNLSLRIMLAEDLITIEDAPGGTNGETEYHHVFKAFVGGPAGIDIADTWAVGDVYTIDESLALGDYIIYHYDGLEVFAIVQNDDDKFVHQAAVVHDIEITTSFTNNSSALEISGLPEICSGEQTITPSVKIQNSGNDDLTSLDIVYDVNGGASQTVSWTGNLSTLASEVVMLDAITFTAGADNNVNVTLENPNGTTDESTNDNTVTAPIAQTDLSVGNLITITLNTDCWPEENTWSISNSSGDVVAAGGPYNGQTETEIIETATLADDIDCYAFNFTDSYGDGLHGSQWNGCDTDGSLVITDESGTELINYDGSFDAPTIDQAFEARMIVGVQENVLNDKFTVSPNPINDNATLNFTLNDKYQTQVRVMNVTGEVVFVKDLGNLSAGDYTETLQLGNLSAGVYFINLISGEETGVKKVSVIK
jgi:hypothetical protein